MVAAGTGPLNISGIQRKGTPTQTFTVGTYGQELPAPPQIGSFGVEQPVQPDTTGSINIGDLVSNYQTRLEATQPIIQVPDDISTQVEGLRPNLYQGRSQDFYDLQKESAREALRKEFFGTGGVEEQTIAAESAAGRLGGGVAGQRIQQLVADPFVEQFAQIDRDVLSAQLDDEAKTRELNAQLQADFNKTLSSMMAKDSENQMLAEQANAEMQAAYDELAVKLANATSEQELDLIDLQLKNYEAAIKEYQAQVDAAAKERELYLQELDMELPADELPKPASILGSKPKNIGQTDYDVALFENFVVPDDNTRAYELIQVASFNDGKPFWLDSTGTKAYDARTGERVLGMQGSNILPEEQYEYIPQGYTGQ